VPEPRDVRQLRVLLVLAESEGGISRHVGVLAAGLVERGASVTLCTTEGTAHGLDPGRLTGVRLVRLPVGRRAPWSAVTTRRVLRREAAKVDVVHAHGLRAGVACATAGAGERLVVTWHNAALGGGLPGLAHRVLSRYIARRAAVTVAASDDLAAAAHAAGARDVRNMFVAAPALPSAQQDPAQVRRELGVGDRPLVLAVGRLHPQKRFDVLVAAATAWAGQSRGPVVVIAGEGPARSSLVAQIAAGDAPVRLLGARNDVAELLAAADVVALPSAWEARSLVAQEAMLAGVPLVTTAVGGLPSLVGDGAVLVPAGDVVALRAAIERLLSEPVLRATMAARGVDRARAWPSLSVRIDDLVNLYLYLTSTSRHAA
jgi:glycosyltransferase involved in cell wall biosynthesis